MSVIDELLSEDICEVEGCGNEAFRHCIAGCGWRCNEHLCLHLETNGKPHSWLSQEAVLGRMSDTELASIRLRLGLQLRAVDNEIWIRKARQSISLQEEFSSARKAKKAELKSKNLLAKFLEALTPKQVEDLTRKLKKEKKDEP